VRRWATSAEIAASRMLLADGGSGLDGGALGRCVRGGSFAYDPFAAYGAGLVTSPNMLVAGSIGTGKSTVVKMLAARGLARGARVAVLDPKGEYAELAARHGGEVVDFSAGSSHAMSPFVGEAALDVPTAESVLAVVLERPLSEEERFVLAEQFAALRASGRLRPLRAMAESLAVHRADRSAAPERTLALALRRLVDGDLAGIVDAESREVSRAPVVVCDLSSVWGSDRFALCALAATAAARRCVDDPEVAGYLVIDEAWALLSEASTARWLQGSFKLARARATSHVLVLHRWSDAFASAPMGSALRTRVVGLLRDCDSSFILRQDHGELAVLAESIGLNDREAGLLTELPRGVALVRYGPHRSILRVEPTPDDLAVIDTDAAMRAFA